MASNDICELCFGKGQSVTADKLCTECDERLCSECAAFHLGFKAFKSHHLIQLTSIAANISSFPKYCSVHEDMPLDFYCTLHSTVCCRMCIPKTHQLCTNVVPLETVFKDVEKSTLYAEIVTELNNICLTLEHLFQDRESNLQKIRNSASSIKENIAAYKQQLIRQIDDLERKLIQSLNSIQNNLEVGHNKANHDITEKMSKTQQRLEELEFLRSNGTNNQLFLALHKHNQDIHSLETEITEMISRCKVTDIIFKHATLDLSNMATISEQSGPCDIQSKPSKLKQAQEKSAIPSKHLTTFKCEGELQMPQGEDLYSTDIAVTCDHKLLLCNSDTRCPKVFIYTDCKKFEKYMRLSSAPFRTAVIPGTSKAVVTLPHERSIQLITTTSMTKEDKLRFRFEPCGVATSADNIFIGGYRAIHVLDIKGKFQKSISLPNTGHVNFVSLNKGNTELLCRSYDILSSIDLDGNILYQYKVSGDSGIAADGQGDVYVGGYGKGEIHRLSSDGKLKKIILTTEDGINCPTALQFNNEFTKLFIVNYNKTVMSFLCS